MKTPTLNALVIMIFPTELKYPLLPFTLILKAAMVPVILGHSILGSLTIFCRCGR